MFLKYSYFDCFSDSKEKKKRRKKKGGTSTIVGNLIYEPVVKISIAAGI